MDLWNSNRCKITTNFLTHTIFCRESFIVIYWELVMYLLPQPWPHLTSKTSSAAQWPRKTFEEFLQSRQRECERAGMFSEPIVTGLDVFEEWLSAVQEKRDWTRALFVVLFWCFSPGGNLIPLNVKCLPKKGQLANKLLLNIIVITLFIGVLQLGVLIICFYNTNMIILCWLCNSALIYKYYEVHNTVLIVI